MERGGERAVREYYDRNTRRFLLLGGSRRSLTIHRAVWDEQVNSRQQALDTTNRMVLDQAVGLADGNSPLRVIDLGCGVGGSLIYLAKCFPGPLTGLGVTISPVQTEIAQANAQRAGLERRCSFITASYLDLPELPPVDLAFAIESFILGPDAIGFFVSAAGALRPGGRLVVIDDFVAEQPGGKQNKELIATFRQGWRAESLTSVPEVERLAEAAGFALVENRDLSPLLRFHSLRDRLVSAAVTLGKLLSLHRLLGQAYWDSLVGGNALQVCLRTGSVQYRMMVWAKVKTTGQET